MPHPLDEVQNTPWGINTDDRLDMLEHRVKELDMNMVGFRQDLQANTTQTNSIKSDTKWLVDVFRGSRALGPFIVGISVFLASVAVFWAWVHGK